MNAHPRQTTARWAIASAIGLALAAPVSTVLAQSTPAAPVAAAAQAAAPDAFVKRITDEVFATVKADNVVSTLLQALKCLSQVHHARHRHMRGRTGRHLPSGGVH